MSNDELNFEEPIVEAAMEQEEQMAADPHTLLDESVVESEVDAIATEKEEDFIIVDNLSAEEDLISEEGAWEDQPRRLADQDSEPGRRAGSPWTCVRPVFPDPRSPVGRRLGRGGVSVIRRSM